jgi:DNA-binding HxlR family transcriptional regulator
VCDPEDPIVKRTRFGNVECPVARSLDVIGDWWSLLIIRDALTGSRRFSEFQKGLGLAKNILTVRLRALVEDGVLKTAPASDGSAYLEYVLTPKGRALFPVLVALRQWCEEFCDRPDELSTLVDRDKGRPVRKLELRAQDGRLLSLADIEVKPSSKIRNSSSRDGIRHRRLPA